MRMIGIGLLAFLVAGMALFMSTTTVAERAGQAARALAGTPELVFETRGAMGADGAHQAVLRASGVDAPVILSGLPAYQAITFDLPRDARITSGYLQIDATSQVLAGVQGVLRISIRNARRAEMLLHPGAAARSLRIPLSPADVAGDRLVVSFSLQGTAPNVSCGPDDGVAAVVEIETTSAVFANLDQPLVTARDQIRAAGGMVPVVWPSKRDEAAEALVLATGLSGHGLAPVIVEHGQAFATSELRGLALGRSSEAVADAWPRTLAVRGANAGLRWFHRETTWRHRYDLGSGSDMRVAGVLDLKMVLGRLAGGQSWQLTVMLNDRLAHQVNIDGGETAFSARIELPADLQEAANTLAIVLNTTRISEGECDQGPMLLAEMLPETQLLAGADTFSDEMTEMQAALAARGIVGVALMSDLSADDAERARRLLARILPVDMQLSAADGVAQVIVLTADGPTPNLKNVGPAWAFHEDGTSSAPTIIRLDADSDPRVGGVSVLIAPEGIGIAAGAS
ncbi:hypothetical protein KUV51_01760 [Tateyamaria omphalii]|uniref:hypothetical protein n=1 Tax=Tateyamaria omphalii TaxID=299262 RepID=UPI001C9A09BE|nr:hypothetical protein [Tateyamaria omphalii]MBY5931710.1 hypothetical protein [Tateyamaria omphalii]